MTNERLLSLQKTASWQIHQERFDAVVVFVWSTEERVGQTPEDVGRFQFALTVKSIMALDIGTPLWITILLLPVALLPLPPGLSTIVACSLSPGLVQATVLALTSRRPE